MKHLIWAAAAAALALGGCMAEETDAEKRRTYAWNVESCICRSLEYEVDYEGRSAWPRLVERCNETVRAANRQRHPADASFTPAIEALRCEDEAAEWLAARPPGTP